MCYAVPGRIIDVRGDAATVDFGGVRKSVNISLVDSSVGDYVLVHAGFAIEKIEEDAALDHLGIIRKRTGSEGNGDE